MNPPIIKELCQVKPGNMRRNIPIPIFTDVEPNNKLSVPTVISEKVELEMSGEKCR